MNNKIKKAVRLKKLINQKMKNGEHNLVKISNTKLSFSDLAVLKLYLIQFINSNGMHFGNLMSPMGAVEKVLIGNDIEIDNSSMGFNHSW